MAVTKPSSANRLKPYLRGVLLIMALGAGIVVYTKAMARIGSGTPPAMAPANAQADAIEVHKASRKMVLLRGGKPIKTCEISLGAAPSGHKAQEGDERTPEGRYVIDWRNERSVAHLSLHISYPNADDIAAAKAAGVPPGGAIMIHGLPNGWGALGGLHRLWDWTNGCVAVTNAEMREIWSLVRDGTPITIWDD